ncbi:MULTISPECIES: GIY-YIG nuclease family protein [unclassified Granulicatella]|uniref:GIY-YIG nuclease family protein n=1 Tax=unclassified Granulicatella TaxID=2630493 RepID=UPI001073DE5F|nr:MULTISPECIES: GIY-YIG nuclease family protein [unclassified Granulicatella]MBF0780389.1 GIY-YIG nuclease family protein [Granulicatella sp. 19428wC4_WM01]TFU95477.1 GIY-YIG nuclease family protein [Granulicatella sp. WM01]
MDKAHYFYVLKCADNTYYAGYTTDVNRRVHEHNTSEKGAKYTKVRRPVMLIYTEKYDTRSLATKAEARFKKLSRTQKEAFLYDTPTKKF